MPRFLTNKGRGIILSNEGLTASFVNFARALWPKMDRLKKYFIGKDLHILSLLAILVVLWFANIIFSNNIFIHRDLSRYFYPLRHFGALAVKDFRLPLWNPYVSCGKPFLAVLQTTVLYPLNLIYYFFPSFDLAFNWYIISHFFLAGIFMYFLMRYWGYCRPAGLISAIIFTFGGYLSSVISMNTSMSSAIWIPVVLLFYDRALKTGKIKFLLVTGILLGFQFLGGIPTPSYCTFWLLFFYTLLNIDSARSRLSSAGRSFGVFIAVYIVFILLFAVQILPFKEMLLNSNLAAGRSIGAAAKWSLRPLELLGFFVPYIYGDINIPSGHLNPQEWMISYYLGVPALILAVIAFYLRPAKKVFFFGVAFLGALLLALGKYTPVYPFLYKFLPGISSIRYPVKFLFLATFSLSVLAGMGFDAVFRERIQAKKKKLYRGLLYINLFLTLIFGAFILYWRKIGYYLLGCFLDTQKIDIDLFNRCVVVFLNDSRYFCQFFIVFTLAVILIILYLREKLSHTVFACLFCLLIIGDLAAVNMGINKTMDRRWFAQVPESVRALQRDDSLYRTFQTGDVWELNRVIFGLNYDEGIWERKKTLASNGAMEYGIYALKGYGSMAVGDYYNFMLFLQEQSPARQLKLLSMLNAKYILSLEPMPVGDLSVFYQDKALHTTVVDGKKIYKNFYILKNPHCLERAFLVPSAVFVDDPAVALGILQNENFDPEKVVIVEGEECFKKPQSAIRNPQYDSKYITIISYKPEEVIVDVEVGEPQWLVLSDTYYPGWEVFVDGQREKIYKANYFLRAVPLPPGKHTVRFVYNPRSFKVGAGISLVTLLAIVVAAFGHGKRLVKRNCI